MKFIRRFSIITIVSCLCVSSGAAVAKVTEQVSNPTSSTPTEPVIIADIFRTIQEGVQTIDQVNQIRLREQRRQEAERRRQELENQKAGEQLEQQPVEQAPIQANNNEDLYQRLARRGNESHEKWYDRITPIINTMPGPNYRAWKATLSPEDRDAYNAITKQRNYEAAEIMNQMTPRIIEGVLQEEEDSRRRQSEYSEY
jgi:hypothetical protein